MPHKKCGLGFDCASMMMQPGIDPDDCLNHKTCGAAYELTPGEQIELIQIREREREEAQQERETVLMSRKQAARMMLMSRGCPQSVDSIGMLYTVESLQLLLSELSSALLEATEDQYIPPKGAEVHSYNVKRGTKIFEYNKLTAASKVFEPVEKTKIVRTRGEIFTVEVEAVRTIHLSRDDDARNIVAREGIKLRNNLSKVETLLNNARQLVDEAKNILEGSN